MGKSPVIRHGSTVSFLADVLVCSLGAYGGPEAHVGVFLDQLVAKRRYLSEEELIELVALCSVLPGPTSTQTIVAVGYKTGGPLRALLTMLVWALPALMLMTALSFLYGALTHFSISREGLRFIGPLAIGFIVMAAYRIGRKVVVDRVTIALFLVSAATTFFVRSPWVFPALLLAGAAVTLTLSGERDLWKGRRPSPPWGYLVAFFALALGLMAATLTWDVKLVHLFESFYRYGYLVFGGGQVVVPLMHGDLVSLRGYMTDAEFLTGYGLVQGLPGPMFSFSAYAGGMAARGDGTLMQILGALAGGLGIFLPGLLLIYFVYPVWDAFRERRGVKIALKGINAVAGGMIASAALLLAQKSGITYANIGVAALTAIFLTTKKVPAPVIVALALIAGFLL
jgi:chromate transporter